MWNDMTNAEENCEMIWKMWKKSKLNSEKICKIWNKGKLNREKLWKIWKKPSWIVKWYGKYGRKLWNHMEDMEEK